MEKVRLGIIGTGPRARILSRTYAKQPQLEIVAVCDQFEQNVQYMQKDLKEESGYGDIPGYTSYEALLKGTPVDALFIAIDPQDQVDMACDAMERGIHVMTEVPCAYTIEQCQKLVDTVERTGVKYQLAEQTRYWSFIRIWREMARAGKLGDILQMEGEYMHYEANWDYFVDRKNGELFYGSAVAPQGRDTRPTWRYRSFKHPIFYLPHTLSPLLSIVDDRVDKVSCFGSRMGSYQTPGLEVRDLETALMHTFRGTILKVSAGFTTPHGGRSGTWAHWYNVIGTKGSVEWNRSTLDKPKQYTLQDGWSEQDWTTEEQQADEFIKSSGHGGADYYPIDSFVRAILDDTTPPMGVYRAVETAAPAIMAAKSCERGGELMEVPNFRNK